MLEIYERNERKIKKPRLVILSRAAYTYELRQKNFFFVERGRWLVNNVDTKMKCAFFSQICNGLISQIFLTLYWGLPYTTL